MNQRKNYSMEPTQAKGETNRTGRWKKTEHDKFMKAVQKYGKNWDEIQKRVPSRSMSQIRSHAQKIFLKMPKYERKALLRQYSERKFQFCQVELQNRQKKQNQKEQNKKLIENKQNILPQNSNTVENQNMPEYYFTPMFLQHSFSYSPRQNFELNNVNGLCSSFTTNVPVFQVPYVPFMLYNNQMNNQQ